MAGLGFLEVKGVKVAQPWASWKGKVLPRKAVKVEDLDGIVNLAKLTRYCSRCWGADVSPEAAAYFGRLMLRRIREFGPYVSRRNGKPVQLRRVYDAASRYFS